VRERPLLAYGVCLPILLFEVLMLARDRIFPAAIIGAAAQSWIFRAVVVPSTFIIPLELALEQLPKMLRAGERYLGIEYRPFFSAESPPVLEHVLLVISDITGEVERDRDEQAQKELVQVVDHALRDHAGFLEFHQETTRCHELESRMEEDGAPPTAEELRLVRAGWSALCERLKPIIHTADDRVELLPEE